MYAVKIITENGEVALDMTEPSFPYTFESASVAELQDQSASWSYTIQIPRTPLNERVFDEAGEPFARTDIPYRRVMCNAYADGIRIIHNGVLFIDQVTESEYEVQILSGNADIFELMKNIELANMGIITKLPFWNNYPTEDMNQVYLYPRYMILSADKYGNINPLYNTQTRKDVYYYATPILRIGDANSTSNSLMKRIMSAVGYRLVTDTESEKMQNLYISLSDRKRLNNIAVWSSNKYTIVGSGTTANYISSPYNFEYRRKINVRLELYQLPPENVEIRITLGTQTTEGFLAFQTRIVTYTDFVGTRAEFTIEVSQSYNVIGAMYDVIRGRVPGVPFFNSAEFNMDMFAPDDGEFAYAGNMINLGDCLPIKTCFDIFKLCAQIFGWIINVKDKTIEAHTWGYIKSQKELAKDWTDKIVMNEDRNITYIFGEYAKINRIIFQENETITYTDYSEFNINNDNLEREKNVIELSTTSGQGAQVECWKRDYDSEDTQWYKFDWDNNGSHLLIYDGSIIRHLTAEDIKNNYQPLIDTLQRVEVLNVKMLLTAIDIQDFNPYIPIYLRQYGAYYYVNKISEWEEGKPCEVELLRL